MARGNPSVRSKRPSDRRWWLGAWILSAAAGATAIWAFVGTTRTSAPGGCAFSDGSSYCDLAALHKVASPYNRRILDPLLVHVVRYSSVANRFELIDLVSLAITVLAVGLLTRLLATELGAPERLVLPAAICGSALFGLSPYAFRIAKFAPVLVDQPALALGATAVLTLLGSGKARLAAPVLALMAVMTRESWAVPLVGAALVVWASDRDRRPVAAACAFAAVAGGLVVLAVPHLGTQLSPFAVARTRIEYYQHAHGLGDLAYQTGLAVGILPLFVVVAALFGHRTERSHTRVRVVMVVALVSLVQGWFEGADIGRISFQALPFIVALAAAAAVSTTEPLVRSAFAASVVASVLIWQPLATIHGVDAGYRHLQYFTTTGQRPYVAVVATAAALCVVAVAVRATRGRSLSPRT